MNSTHVPRVKHIQQPVAQDRHCSKFGAIWWQSQVSFPFLTHTQNNTPHFSWEKSLYTYSFHSHSWSLLNEKPIMEGSSYKPTVYKRKPLCVSIFWYHICHTGSHWHCLIPQPTSYWPLPYMLLCCITYGTCDTCCTLYFIGITFYM